MKKFLFSGMTAMLCLFISCKDSGTAAAANANAENEKYRTNTKEIYRALETGDVSKVDSIIGKDVVDHGDMGDTHGIDTVKKMFSQFHTQVKDLKMEPIADATDGDYHFTYYHFTGTTNDASMGVPAGTKLDLTGVDMVKIKDGKQVEHWGFSQGRDMIKMMSLNPTMKPCMDQMMQAENNMNGKTGQKETKKS